MITLTDYYDRFDPADNYARHLFLAGNVLQSAELNEIQSNSFYQAKLNADGIFKDGDITRGGGVFINSSLNTAVCQSSTVYIDGKNREVASAALSISLSTTDKIGVWVSTSIISFVDDPTLQDPAVGQDGYGEVGASRLVELASWGLGSVPVVNGIFYGVFDLVSGVLSVKNKSSQFAAIGATHINSGLVVDVLSGQSFLVSRGEAVIDGVVVSIPVDKKITYSTSAPSKLVSDESHLSTTLLSQKVVLAHTPVDSVLSVSVVKQTIHNVVRGSGASDTLPDASVTDVLSVTLGATTYVNGVDYTVVDTNKIDWSLGGAEPTLGQTYVVVYQYNAVVSPVSVDATGFTVVDAVVGTNITASYYAKMPRNDLICLGSDGSLFFVEGQSNNFATVTPSAPSSAIVLAVVGQLWSDTTITYLNNRPTVPELDSRKIEGVIASQMAKSALLTASKRVAFAIDVFEDKTKGTLQSLAVFGNQLTLPVNNIAALSPSLDVSSATVCDYTDAVFIEQPLFNSSIKINPNVQPYAKHKPRAVLKNPTSRWPTVDETLNDSKSAVFSCGHGGVFDADNAVMVGSTKTLLTQVVDVPFTISGFAVGETLDSVSYDGTTISVTGV